MKMSKDIQIQLLYKRCARLIEALQPFADELENHTAFHDNVKVPMLVRIGDLRKAKAAIYEALRTDFSKNEDNMEGKNG